VSNQDWGVGGNDYLWASLFLDVSEYNASVPWTGGVNLTTLRLAELRSLAWADWLTSTGNGSFCLNRTMTGTATGLPMMPYVRDTRRSVGLDGFRLMWPQLVGVPPPSGEAPAPGPPPAQPTGWRFYDVVGIGDYFYADSHLLAPSSGCSYPAYLANATLLPYYLPFRALLNGGASNLLVAGKTMAQTFHANSATRLHPVEWASGTAAGAAAAWMVTAGVATTAAALARVAELQALLVSPVVGTPLEWTFPAA
jgi:hypothetical protein